ncbi:MAG: zinc-regulated TonB-dependent outer membrane receptor [Deltaproteobacteria bacterium]|nr:zinc-regulated TonB-dependent outer membrane receptor [Deltaproteobacteria bacterium]
MRNFWIVALLATAVAARSADAAPAADLAGEPTPAGLSAEDQAALSAAAAADQPAVAPPSSGPSPSANPAISLLFGGSAAAFSRPDPPQMGGHDATGSGFNLHYLELFAESNVDPYFHFQTSIAIGQEGVELEEVFADTLALPGNLHVKAGKFLSDFGRANPTHPHVWSFADQPLLLGKFFGPDGNRAVGAQVGWLLPLPWFAEAKLAAQQAENPCCNRSMLGDTPRPVQAADDLQYTGSLRTFAPLSDDWSLFLGASAQLGPNPHVLGLGTQIAGGDLYLRWRPIADPERRSVSLQVEHARRQRDVGGQSLVDQAGYAHVVAKVALRWEVGWRSEWATGVAGDPLDPDWTSLRTRHAAQATFYPSHFARIRLQVSRDMPGWLNEPVYGALLMVESVVGAHGSHGY